MKPQVKALGFFINLSQNYLPMKMKGKFLLLLFLLVLSALLFQFKWKSGDDDFVFYIADPSQEEIGMYLKDNSGNNYSSIANLKANLHKHNKELLFAMNGGMYKKDRSPQGLYIENWKTLSLLDRGAGDGNFYLKPNGVFSLGMEEDAEICTTEHFIVHKMVKYATQSGPMLVIDSKIHPAFKKGSANLNIRNGVGILPDGKVLFAMSKKEINFYDFAEFFKNKGCENALYLDGFVSRMYCPTQNWIQTDGDFGVIIGIVSKK